MTEIAPAPRLDTLQSKRIVLLDCGKRGGSAILTAVADALVERGATCLPEVKTSAHRMASRRLIEAVAERADAVVYGVVD